MKKNLLYTVLGLVVSMGISVIGAANANDTGCWSGLGTVPSDTYATGIIYGCDGDIPVISIYSGRLIGITLKANNEGTGVVKIGSGKTIDAYGGLYQRGNSFSFPSVADNVTQIISGNTRVSTDGYGPQTISGFYYSEVWIKQMKRTSNDNRNTWGGGLDGNGNKWGYNILSTTVENRRGPCPTGYHIPSAGEWNMLLNIRGTNYKGSENITRNLDYTYLGYGTISYAGIGNKFSNDIMLPFIANREYDTSFKNGDFGFYWASSPSGSSDYARRVLIDENSIQANKYNLRGSGRGIRCFRDSYIKLPEIFNITLNNNGEHIGSGEIESGSKIPIDVISGYNLTGLTKVGYTFSGWIISGSNEMFDVENDVVTTGMTLNAVREINQYTITFDTDGGSAIEPITADYGTGISVPANPTKNGYKFVSWDKEIPANMPAENLTIKAIWEKIGYSGGGGRSSRTSDTQDSSTSSQNDKNTENVIQSDPEHSEWGSEESSNTPIDSSDKSSEGQEILSPSDSSFTKEQKDAYEFAKEKGITTMPTIQEAQMDGKLTRIAMAKMLSQYAMNVLGQKPANIVTPKFNDVTDKQNSDYDDGVTLAYQLGIMGQNMPNNKFRPDDEVTRAEFATALSRMAYGTSDGEYKGTGKYYIHHMEKLVKEGIITNDNPTMKELRGYVMIMLKRSAK